MLFVQDDLRVLSASYAVTAKLDFDRPDPELRRLQRAHTVLAYLYGAPHDTHDLPAFGPAETSLALFTPARVIKFLTRPDHHTVRVGSEPLASADERHELQGYNGLFSFSEAFRVEKSGRVYGPRRHVMLNIAQDLLHDFGERGDPHSAPELLFGLLRRFDASTGDRIMIALDWYNAAHPTAATPDRALLNLAVAFESLLRLPRDAKTDRFVDAVSLLLGRTARLDEWAAQFYAARSNVAHEGQTGEHFYRVPRSGGRRDGDRFGSLMLYGRQVFRLCLKAVVFGIELAREDGLAERLIDNSERFKGICEALKHDTGEPAARLLSIEPTIRAAAHFRFVASDGPSVGPMLAAVSAGAAALADCDADLDPAVSAALGEVTARTRQDGELAQLEAIRLLHDAFKALPMPALDTPRRVMFDLVDLVWMAAFRRYFALRDRRGPAGG